jgi:hypothetical protein
VILIAGAVNGFTGTVVYVTAPAKNTPEDARGMTGYENSVTGAERIFAGYVRRPADYDPLLTYSVNFLTDYV